MGDDWVAIKPPKNLEEMIDRWLSIKASLWGTV
ncbi:hypothetical protein HDF12_001899 [Edaphobacter lichenicola]|uniref:Uncharacterized protein n=1 Tax=Tunturiibacter lichenicola TaxID=2051959 RepID=A0A7Y9NLF1_9BACT|nr:hypothetical protein [Edaphobacter lichenicola]